MADVLFFTHATAETGFGHAARCARLAAILARLRPGLGIAFEGAFSDGAWRWLAGSGARRSTGPGEHAAVGIYDRMDDTEEPEAFDAGAVAEAARRCGRLFFMANGHQRPAVPAGVTVIGYKPGGPSPEPPSLLWGLEYAPVAPDMLPDGRIARDPGRALVSLGGAASRAGLANVMAALARQPTIRVVELLGSPVNAAEGVPAGLRPDQTLVRSGPADRLADALARAGLVVASYGHLGYEAIAGGAPVCLVGVKPFQVRYAEILADAGLCIAGGAAEASDPSALAAAVASAIASAARLERAGPRAIDGRGIERIAALIAGELDRAA